MGAWIETITVLYWLNNITSHPVWVRGLKLLFALSTSCIARSHPVWVRGLKLAISDELSQANPVAPRVGAWIETTFGYYSHGQVGVAPRVGAWIETPLGLPVHYKEESHPVWVRGLKLTLSTPLVPMSLVAPRVGAWIETFTALNMVKLRSVAPRVGAWIETKTISDLGESIKSHPVWVRGLKRAYELAAPVICASHPVWVRGLKQCTIFCRLSD